MKNIILILLIMTGLISCELQSRSGQLKEKVELRKKEQDSLFKLPEHIKYEQWRNKMVLNGAIRTTFSTSDTYEQTDSGEFMYSHEYNIKMDSLEYRLTLNSFKITGISYMLNIRGPQEKVKYHLQNYIDQGCSVDSRDSGWVSVYPLPYIK